MSRFIGFIRLPKLLERYELTETDVTVMNLNQLVQIKEDKKLKMKNDNYSFDFAVEGIEKLSAGFSIAFLNSSKAKLLLTESPFQIFGKTFNVRVKGTQEFGYFSVVLSQSALMKKIKNNILAHFIQAAPEFKGFARLGMQAPTDTQTLFQESKQESAIKRSGSLIEEDSLRSIIETPGDVYDRNVPLLFKNDGGKMQLKLLNVAAKTSCFDIRGPFGPGLQISRFTFGRVLVVGQGTGAFSFLDLVDYIARLYIYRFAKSRISDLDQTVLKQLDPFDDDFDQTFNNDLSFDFYFTFRSVKDFEATFLPDLQLAYQIESRLKLGVLGKVVVCLPKTERIDGTNYPEIAFTDQRLDRRQAREFSELFSLGGDAPDKKVEKVIACGSKGLNAELKAIAAEVGLEHALTSL